MKSALITLLFFLTLQLTASVNPIDLVILDDPTSRTLILRTTTEVEQQTKIRLSDADGLTLYTTRLDSGDYLNVRLKLAALPAGTYTLDVSDEQGRTVQPIDITGQGVIADPALATRTFFPRVDLRDKLLTINYLNPAGKQVDIRLEDRQGNKVIFDRLPGENTVQRAYSLKNLPSGDYFVTVSTTGTPTYTTSLQLD